MAGHATLSEVILAFTTLLSLCTSNRLVQLIYTIKV